MSNRRLKIADPSAGAMRSARSARLGVVTLGGGSRVMRPAHARRRICASSHGACTLAPRTHDRALLRRRALATFGCPRGDGSGHAVHRRRAAAASYDQRDQCARNAAARRCGRADRHLALPRRRPLFGRSRQNGTTGLDLAARLSAHGRERQRARSRRSIPAGIAGRTIHIHVMARYYDTAGNMTYKFTTQLFFDDATSDGVLANYPYNTRGDRNTTNQNDGIYDASMLLDLRATAATARSRGDRAGPGARRRRRCRMRFSRTGSNRL